MFHHFPYSNILLNSTGGGMVESWDVLGISIIIIFQTVSFLTELYNIISPSPWVSGEGHQVPQINQLLILCKRLCCIHLLNPLNHGIHCPKQFFNITLFYHHIETTHAIKFIWEYLGHKTKQFYYFRFNFSLSLYLSLSLSNRPPGSPSLLTIGRRSSNNGA